MTIVFDPLSLFLPYYCCSCEAIGAILCESCYYDIVSEPDNRCLACQRPLALGSDCDCPRIYSRNWYVAAHDNALKALVAASKFDSVRAGCDKQAELLDDILPDLPDSVVVVPVPTIAKHIRQRGYAHAERIARKLAARRQLPYQQIFTRTNQLVQHGATKKARIAQAARSYRLNKKPNSQATYLIVDDVYTTGATISTLAGLLSEVGVKPAQIWVAVTARQTGH